MKHCLIIWIGLFAAIWNVAAQTGEISGVILDKATGEPMAGAAVAIESLATGTAADVDGKYSLRVAPGVYTLKFMFLSYNTVELTGVEVKADKTTEAGVVMEESAVGINEVTVVAVRKMNSEAAMLSAMKTSGMVMSGVSSQQITRTQDRDASEVIKRIPGISVIDNRFIIARGLSQRYNNVWVNNSAVPGSEADSRSFSFDMIPSGQIEHIMIVKSPAPELPADFTGGFVRIATKNMPETNSIQASYGININTATHFNDFKYAQGSATDFLGFDNGFRDMRSVVPKRRMDNGNTALVTDVTRNGFNNNWQAGTRQPLADHRFSFMINRYRKTLGGQQLGLVAALNYSYGYLAYFNMTNARFGIYNKMDDRPEYFYKYADDQYTSTAKTGGMLNLIWMLNDDHRLEFRNIFNQQGRDRYTWRDGWQNISAKYMQRKEEYFYNSRGTYTGQLSGSHTFSDADIADWTAGYSYGNRNQPDRRQIDREEELDRFRMNSIIRDFNRLDEHMYSAGLNYVRSLDFGRLTPLLKAGAYAEYRFRTYHTRYFLYKTDVRNLPSDFLYGDVATEMMRPEYFASDKFYISDASDRTNDYKGRAFLGSGYAGISLPLGKFNIYTGVRYENSRMALTNHITLDTEDTETFDYNQAGFFPSVNATYNFNRSHLLRLACGKSVNRQEFREVSPSTYYDFDLFSFVRGNKKLKQASVQNFDLRYEIYPSSGEMISVALFYKRFTNPIEWTYIDAGGSYTFTFENADRADNYGLELDMKKSLDFVGLSDFSLAFNGALIRSQVKFSESSSEHDRPMQGQSPYLVNAGLFYQHDTWSAGLMYNIIGKRITGIGRTDNSQGGSIDNDVPDMYELPRNVIDLSFGYKCSKYIELSAGIRDLLAEPVIYRQYPEFTDDAGHIQKREQTTKAYKPGRNVSLTLKINL